MQRYSKRQDFRKRKRKVLKMRAEEICTHYGEDPSRFHGAVNVPLFQTSLFVDCEGNESGREGRYAYTRVSNPTTEIVEKRWRHWNRGRPQGVFPPAWERSARL